VLAAIEVIEALRRGEVLCWIESDADLQEVFGPIANSIRKPSSIRRDSAVLKKKGGFAGI
jgi:hypothetical protein